MRPDPRFLSLPKDFWAAVRSIGEELGYTTRGQGKLKTPSAGEIAQAFFRLNLDPAEILNDGKPTRLGENLVDYFKYRGRHAGKACRTAIDECGAGPRSL